MCSRVVGVSFLAVLLAIAACNNTRNSPTQPSSAGSSAAAGGGGTSSTASLTASIAAPRPLTPVQNAQIRNQDQPVTLVVQNAIVTRTIATTYTFEVATDAGFANKLQIKDGISEGGGGQTSVRLDSLPPSKDFYWHARATAGATTGVFGPPSKFTIGAAITLSPPAPIAPLTGAQVGVRPTFTVSNAARTGPINGAITYRFEIADNAAFNPITLASPPVGEGSNQTSFTPTVDLTTNKTYSWRAIAIDASDGVQSTPSLVQVFTPTAASSGGGGSVAANIAAQMGVTLWSGIQPSGANGRSVLGDGWQIHTESAFYGGTFQSPTLEALQIFDLMDRGFDPQGAIDWMHQNGYPTNAAYFPGVGSSLGVIGFSAQYIAFINGSWNLVRRVGA